MACKRLSDLPKFTHDPREIALKEFHPRAATESNSIFNTLVFIPDLTHSLLPYFFGGEGGVKE